MCPLPLSALNELHAPAFSTLLRQDRSVLKTFIFSTRVVSAVSVDLTIGSNQITASRKTKGMNRSELECLGVVCKFQKPEEVLQLLDMEDAKLYVDFVVLGLFFLKLQLATYQVLRYNKSSRDSRDLESASPLIKAFILEASSEKQECILTHFSELYHHCNPTTAASVDMVHFMTCAMMLLNTDLYGHYGGIKKISSKDFLSNLRRVDGGLVFPKKLSKQLYHSVRKKKLECGKDDDDDDHEHLVPGKTDTSASTDFCCSSAQHLASVDDCNAVHKTGYLIRKRLTDKNGKRRRKGKKAWKPF
ncbi:hypothetical protein P4O66_016385 [Electrophorus voltai]|uniref:SEC7 domain-containing protein n=1 Tax=Electrophorus voltai TaxID=2609070 RepID=A0AAD8YWS2_9TELE|nr:hypothetical protein P4O66_016385 [Electrophorus voltai]